VKIKNLDVIFEEAELLAAYSPFMMAM